MACFSKWNKIMACLLISSILQSEKFLVNLLDIWESPLSLPFLFFTPFFQECKIYHGTFVGSACSLHGPYIPDVLFWSVILFFTTFFLSSFLKQFKTKRYFPTKVIGVWFWRSCNSHVFSFHFLDLFQNNKILFEVSNFMSSSCKQIIHSEKCSRQTGGRRAEEEGGTSGEQQWCTRRHMQNRKPMRSYGIPPELSSVPCEDLEGWVGGTKPVRSYCIPPKLSSVPVRT